MTALGNFCQQKLVFVFSKFYKLVSFMEHQKHNLINFTLCVHNVVLSKMKVDLKKVFFGFVKQTFGLWGFKMVAKIRKRTKTRREVIKILFNKAKTKENRYK